MKKVIAGILSVLAIALTVPLFACSKSTAPEYQKFENCSKYKNFADGVVAIDVRWAADGYWDEFTVTDAEQVNEIVTLFKNATMKKLEEFPDGANGGVDFVYGDGTKVGAGIYINEYKGACYSFENNAISTYINSLRSGTNN